MLLMIAMVPVALSDWYLRRISNSLNLVILLAALCVFFSEHSLSYQTWLINAALALCITLPGYLRGAMGGGDVKLLLALSPAWNPVHFMLVFAVGIGTLLTILAAAQAISSCRRPVTGRLLTAAPLQRGLPVGTAIFVGMILTAMISAAGLIV
ncbi:prepilin peptidase [Spongiibacter sp.]|uniref:prepilin peptidase n=1 Tax=Spongiibacter sp. TaxID=2024860 RepID=UPI0035651C9E